MFRTQTILPLLAVLTALSFSGCVRDVPEIEGPIEGTFVRGRVVMRRADSGALEGVTGLRVGLFGTSLSTRTEEDGSFSLVRLPKGNFRLRIERPEADGSHTLLRTIGGISLLVDRQQLSLGDIDIGGQGDLKGEVWLSDQPRADAAEGSLIVVTETSFRGVVDAEGRYRVAGVPAGDFDVVAFRAGYAPSRAPDVAIEASETKELSRFTLSPADANLRFRAEGQVTLLDESGEALPSSEGVSIELISETSTSAAFSAQSGTDGAYGLELPVGVYRARFEKSGFAPLEIYGVAVLPEGTLGLAPIYLSPTAAIATALDRDGDGCADTSDAFVDDPRYCLDSDGDGEPDPIDPDMDGDALSNLDELSVGSDPRRADTDGDGATDGVDLCPTIFESSPGLDADGDGVGDACDDEPVITDFFPKRGGPGSRITLVGERFSRLRERNLVLFEPGVPAPIIDATANQLVVEVVSGVETGPITVSNGLGATETVEEFVRLPQPVIEQLVPERAQPGQLIRIYGRRFRVDPTDTTVRVSFQGSTGPTPAVDVPIIDDAGRERVEVNAPVALGSYVVDLIGPGGLATGIRTLVVSDGPEILALLPARAPTGVRITIEGRNFALGPEMSVEFGDTDGAPGGVGSVVALAASDLSLDGRQISVVVPVDATTGPLTLRLPNGEASAHFEVDPLAAVLDTFEPSLAFPDETVTVYFRNVDPADTVSFEVPGDASPIVVSPSGTVAGGRTFVLPSGARAGVLTAIVTKSGGSPERLASAQKLGVIRSSIATTEWYVDARPLYWARGANQDQVMVMGSLRMGSSGADLTLRPLLNAPGAPGDLLPAGPDRARVELGWVDTADPRGPEAHPTRPRAVYANLNSTQPDVGRVVIYDLEANLVLGTCPNTAFSNGVRIAFDPARARAVAAYGYTSSGGLVFIDLDAGTCQPVSWDGVWDGVEQIHALTYLEDRLFVFTSDGGILEVEHQLPTSDPAFGRPSAVLPALPGNIRLSNGAVSSYDRTKLWAASSSAVHLIDPLTGTALRTIPNTRNNEYVLASIGRGRFVVADDQAAGILTLIDGRSQRARSIDLSVLYPGLGYARPVGNSSSLGVGSPVPRQDGARDGYDGFLVLQLTSTNFRHLLRLSIEVDDR